jgi:hypothetical protein
VSLFYMDDANKTWLMLPLLKRIEELEAAAV